MTLVPAPGADMTPRPDAEIAAALERVADRLERCLIASGTDPEFAAEAVRAERELIERLRGKG